MPKKYGKNYKKLTKLCQNENQNKRKTMNKQVRKFNGKSTENMMVSDGAEPRLALYSCVILHFGGFRKREKILWKINATTT